MWPAVVEKKIDINRFIVHFFGDYSRASVHRNCFKYNFVNGFFVFNQMESKNLKLSKAVSEASMLHTQTLRSNYKRKNCAICTMFESV